MKFNKLAILICFGILLSEALFADSIDLKKAITAGVNWYQNFAPADKKSGRIIYVKEIRGKENINLYFLQFDKGGFVVVTGNDQAEPILGYSFEGSPADSILNPAVKDLLESYSHQIDTLTTLRFKSASANSKWQQLLSNTFLKSKSEIAGPFLMTNWDQGCYYNEMCPPDPNGTCGHTYAGCTATAMAQILKFWNYPSGGVGYKSYMPRNNRQYGTQSVFFNETDYHWDQMPDFVTMQNSAVAEIMYHCGVSASMDYSIYGSGAYLERALTGLKTNFDYSDSIKWFPKSEPIDSYNLIIKQNLFKGRPVLMQGYNQPASSGHVWVCDGYQNNFFHMNWGWSGSGNGYWLLDNLLPFSIDLNFYQAAVINIFPSYSLPSADFYSFKKEIPFTVQFVDNSKGNPDSFHWDFGDSMISTQQNPVHSYAGPGDYKVRLILSVGPIIDTLEKWLNIVKEPFVPVTSAMMGNNSKIVAVDNNCDGFQDVVITGYRGNWIYQNDAGQIDENGTEFLSRFLSPGYIKADDFDHDGDPDLLMTGQNQGINFLYYFNNDSTDLVQGTLEGISISKESPFSLADYNNDGKVDLLLENQLFRNLGNGKYYKQCLIGSEAALSAWEDFDLDGDLDVAIRNRLFTNQGNGSFVDVGFSISESNWDGWGHYNFEWGDYNLDGLPDLLMGGSIVKNLGNNQFEQIFFIPSSHNGSNYSIWGDVDSDGDLDILTIHPVYMNGYSYSETEVRLNESGIFRKSNSNLQGVWTMGSIDWIDFNHDNRIDLLLTGYFPDDSTGSGNNWISVLYKNNFDRTNTCPSIPNGLTAEKSGNSVLLSWNASIDSETQKDGLTYNLRIGTTRYGNEILSSMSDPITGARWINGKFNLFSEQPINLHSNFGNLKNREDLLSTTRG